MTKINLARKSLSLPTGINRATALLAFGIAWTFFVHSQSRPEDASLRAPRFEVAAIRPAQPTDNSPILRPTLDGISVRSCTLESLIAVAYQPPLSLYNDYPIIGLPKWANSDRYDIEAKVSGSDVAHLRELSRDQQEQELFRMLQVLLADRFQLKLHKKPIELPIYELVAVKSGPRFKPGRPEAGFPHGELRVTPGRIQAIGVSMERLSWALGMKVERGVVDRTGLSGTYNFSLQWQPEDRTDSGALFAQPENRPGGNSFLPSIFTALREQLGLKLKSAKAPGEALVIDHVAKPSPN